MKTAFGMHRDGERQKSKTHLMRLSMVSAIAFPLAYLAGQVLPQGRGSQDYVAMSILLAIAGFPALRHLVVVPMVARLTRRRILVLGTGEEARAVEASMAAEGIPGMTFVGFVALDELHEVAVARQRIVARSATLEEAVRELGVDEIIVAVRQQRGGVLPLRSLLKCRLDGVRVTDLSRFFERVHGHVPVASLKASWLIYANGYRQNRARALAKRVFDIAIAASLLFLTLPVMLVTALLVWSEDGGPVVYRQRRVGAKGVVFTLLKFRSMALNAEVDGEASWAAVNDTRVTRIGRWLRRSRIDELPQLLNVLQGEMSFVGPRPERPEFVAMLRERIPFYDVRHSVKPGLTGWAQVRYAYSGTIEQSAKKLEYDLYYVKNHTLLLDCIVLLETIRVVLLGQGAR